MRACARAYMMNEQMHESVAGFLQMCESTWMDVCGGRVVHSEWEGA